jgi:hypothetical protein
VIYDNNGGVLAVYPPGSEGHSNFYRGLEILTRMYRKYLANIQNEKKKREERVTQILDQTDKKIIKRQSKEN